MQKRAIRICGNSDYRAHTFTSLNLLCLPDMVNFNSMVFMYKVFNLLDPGFLGDFTAFQYMGQYNAQLH